MGSDPFKELAKVLTSEINRSAGNAVTGVPSVLGTWTGTGVMLDNFKHELHDPLFADWTVKAELPLESRLVKLASPVQADGKDDSAAPTQYSRLTRVDWNAKNDTLHMHLELKSELKSGDRVLCVPINGGQDVVIVCKVVN